MWNCLLIFLVCACGQSSCFERTKLAEKDSTPKEVLINNTGKNNTPVFFGSEVLLRSHLSELVSKRIAIVCNHTAVVYDSVHLVDALRKSGVKIQRIFAPEHGFRGDAEAGVAVADGKDLKTGLPIVSLYGKRKKPTPEELADVDMLLFDIQDVGARFYTYLSTMIYTMEAAAEAEVEYWVLDRPNPNGQSADGPVLEKDLISFTGVHAGVPIVHGMTLGEYAKMAVGEKWLSSSKVCKLRVISMTGYEHKMSWEATGRKWIPPSPNLPTLRAAACYPYLCWFEGTIVSIGRGTDKPFEQSGFPYHLAARRVWIEDSAQGAPHYYLRRGAQLIAVAFVPQSIAGKSVHPLYEKVRCWGFRIDSLPADSKNRWLLALELLKNYYQEWMEYKKYHRQSPNVFFNSYFETLAGQQNLRRRIEIADEEIDIYKSWQPAVNAFRQIRAKYLLYPDN
jgi:uncharacterized protein YbbC (DUF1343 family)